MIIPSVRYFHSPDIDDLDGYRPERPDCFSFSLMLFVGPQGEKGEEAFEIVVLTPTWLLNHHRTDDLVSGRHRLIVFRYDWPRIERYIRDRVSECGGQDWSDAAQRVGRFARWEFEDYVEPKSATLDR